MHFAGLCNSGIRCVILLFLGHGKISWEAVRKDLLLHAV